MTNQRNLSIFKDTDLRMRYTRRKIFFVAVFIFTVKLFLIYFMASNLEYNDTESARMDKTRELTFTVGFGEFRDGKFVLTEISDGDSLDQIARQQKAVIDRIIQNRNFSFTERKYNRERRLLRQSTLNVTPRLIKIAKVRKLLPDDDDPVNDRIMEQLEHIPIQYSNTSTFKTIYMVGSQRGWGHPPGQNTFVSDGCLVNRCRFTYDKSDIKTADAVVFGNPNQLYLSPLIKEKPRHQIWILSAIEAPPHTSHVRNYRGLFNWTMTFRTDSIIVTPYFKYKSHSKRSPMQPRNFAAGKTKKVVWFVSNCLHEQSGRMQYARELQKHIDVDIYGRCGDLKCSKKDEIRCKTMVKTDYKFYLAFENVKCKDYMTEKVRTGYINNAIPVLLGAASWEYKNALPAHSYIDVEDFKSPKDLAEYLHKLDQNDDLFNNYFKWREYGSFVASKPWCRVCSLLHETSLPSIWYDDLDKWWRSQGTCVSKDLRWWKNVKDI